MYSSATLQINGGHEQGPLKVSQVCRFIQKKAVLEILIPDHKGQAQYKEVGLDGNRNMVQKWSDMY